MNSEETDVAKLLGHPICLLPKTLFEMRVISSFPSFSITLTNTKKCFLFTPCQLTIWEWYYFIQIHGIVLDLVLNLTLLNY